MLAQHAVRSWSALFEERRSLSASCCSSSAICEFSFAVSPLSRCSKSWMRAAERSLA